MADIQTKSGSTPAHVFVARDADRTHTLVFGVTAKGKSVMPDHCELTTVLATKAFEMIGANQFCVSADLSVDNPESLKAFGVLESILLMAYREGAKAMQSKTTEAVEALKGTKWVSIEAAGECADAIRSIQLDQ